MRIYAHLHGLFIERSGLWTQVAEDGLNVKTSLSVTNISSSSPLKAYFCLGIVRAPTEMGFLKEEIKIVKKMKHHILLKERKRLYQIFLEIH